MIGVVCCVPVFFQGSLVWMLTTVVIVKSLLCVWFQVQSENAMVMSACRRVHLLVD